MRSYRGMWRQKYYFHKRAAELRGIEFLFTFDEWLTTWEQSGHLHERGCRKGQYVMARLGDRGPYAVGNVKIITCQQNNRETDKAKLGHPRNKFFAGFKHLPETKLQIGRSLTGRKRPDVSEANRKRVWKKSKRR